jgi:2-desacetyl-2-hydroxyethyl bacteriochlorophyllide A dehydrogenase
MHIFKGTQPYLSYPRVMGHELAGEVVDAPAKTDLSPGDQVCVMPYFSCGGCVACRKGRPNCCVHMQVLGVHRDGGLAQYISVPAAFVIKAEGVSLDEAAMVEFLAIGAHAIARASPQPNDRILIVGAGPIGMAVILFAKRRGATVTVLDSRTDRLEFCCEVLGADHVVAVGPTADQALIEISENEGYDIVFDASGSAEAMSKGFDYVCHAGKYALISIVPQNITFSDPEFHKREMTLLGCRNATHEDFAFVLECLRQQTIPARAFNTHRAALSDLPDVFPAWLNPAEKVIKAIVEV